MNQLFQLRLAALPLAAALLVGGQDEATNRTNPIKTIPSRQTGQGNLSRVIGRVTKVQPDLQSVDITTDLGTQATFFSDRLTTLHLGDRTANLANLRAGERVEAIYGAQGDKMILTSLELQDPKDRRTIVEAASRTGGTMETGTAQFHGRVTRVLKNPDQLVFLTDDGRELLLNLDTDRRINIAIETRGNRQYLVGIATEEVIAKPVSAAGITITGQVSRVDLDRQFIEFRTSDGRDLRFHTNVNSKLVRGETALRLRDLSPGNRATIIYEDKDNLRLIRSMALDNTQTAPIR